ncbi:MAG: hypothetical protein AAFS00_20315 [Bacteroidota bacterium]
MGSDRHHRLPPPPCSLLPAPCSLVKLDGMRNSSSKPGGIGIWNRGTNARKESAFESDSGGNRQRCDEKGV